MRLGRSSSLTRLVLLRQKGETSRGNYSLVCQTATLLLLSSEPIDIGYILLHPRVRQLPLSLPVRGAPRQHPASSPAVSPARRSCVLGRTRTVPGLHRAAEAPCPRA